MRFRRIVKTVLGQLGRSTERMIEHPKEEPGLSPEVSSDESEGTAGELPDGAEAALPKKLRLRSRLRVFVTGVVEPLSMDTVLEGFEDDQDFVDLINRFVSDPGGNALDTDILLKRLLPAASYETLFNPLLDKVFHLPFSEFELVGSTKKSTGVIYTRIPAKNVAYYDLKVFSIEEV